MSLGESAAPPPPPTGQGGCAAQPPAKAGGGGDGPRDMRAESPASPPCAEASGPALSTPRADCREGPEPDRPAAGGAEAGGVVEDEAEAPPCAPRRSCPTAAP